MKRLVSIDVLRGAAILMMIQVHFVEYLSPREVSSALLYDLSKHLGVLPAPLFMFLMGLSLWQRAGLEQDRPSPRVDPHWNWTGFHCRYLAAGCGL